MSFMTPAIHAAECSALPDSITKAGINFLVSRTRRRLATSPITAEADFARTMAGRPIAEYVETANDQHYELPPDFFALILGPLRKYSCCLYRTGQETLTEAEALALEETVQHAELADGQNILELGCGWGALSLFIAARFPAARITAVSNSTAQRLHIEQMAHASGLSNITVVTADMNAFEPTEIFDRIVSVEMFEHMSNWRKLLTRAKSWLSPQGRLFMHVFSHRSQPYRFDHRDEADWIARHFFTGGIMPSHGLIAQFSDSFIVARNWRWSGLHYQRTALDWLANFDANAAEINRILVEVYGQNAAIWHRRWRLFYLATAGLFGCQKGSEWGVSHYLLRPAP